MSYIAVFVYPTSRAFCHAGRTHVQAIIKDSHHFYVFFSFDHENNKKVNSDIVRNVQAIELSTTYSLSLIKSEIIVLCYTQISLYI